MFEWVNDFAWWGWVLVGLFIIYVFLVVFMMGQHDPDESDEHDTDKGI